MVEGVLIKKKASKGVLSRLLVPVVGVEPTRYRYHRILSPARLPIPPYRHIAAAFATTRDIIAHRFAKIK